MRMGDTVRLFVPMCVIYCECVCMCVSVCVYVCVCVCVCVVMRACVAGVEAFPNLGSSYVTNNLQK